MFVPSPRAIGRYLAREDIRVISDQATALSDKLKALKKYHGFATGNWDGKYMVILNEAPISRRAWALADTAVEQHFKLDIPVEKIDRNELNSFITRHIKPVIRDNNGEIGTPEDRWATSCTYADLERIVKHSPVPITEYVPESNDCDNYARKFCDELTNVYKVMACHFVKTRSHDGLAAHGFVAVWTLDKAMATVDVTTRTVVRETLRCDDSVLVLKEWVKFMPYGY